MSYFNTVNKVQYEGPKSRNPLAFKYYNPEELVLGKERHLRFATWNS